ncbi:uncharacterized protein LOC108666168 isoform X2 [Hyalella azteca]|uniref:Uncharacterized protein LOC108666168 isoform X2 n=1 Tax=Hyalella azteca TaxID=294128 RepID=A0A8B7N3P4_HYAAZ|nr:uncharacterized protein LOC108666168 isoform X2 [Hyalella azteca]
MYTPIYIFLCACFVFPNIRAQSSLYRPNSGYRPPSNYPPFSGYPPPGYFPQGALPSQGAAPPTEYDKIVAILSLFAEGIEELSGRIASLEKMQAEFLVYKKKVDEIANREDLSGSESTAVNRVGTPNQTDQNNQEKDEKKSTAKPKPTKPNKPPSTSTTNYPYPKSCPTNFERIGAECFYISSRSYKRLSWQDAQAACSAMDAILADPDTEREVSSLSGYLGQFSSTASYSFWLGALYPGISWRWIFSGAEVPLTPALWTYSSDSSNPVARQAPVDDVPHLLYLRHYLQSNGQSQAPLVKMLENITSAIGEETVARFVAEDHESKKILERMDLGFNPFDSDAANYRRYDAQAPSIASQFRAQGRIYPSPLENFFNPLFSFFNPARPNRGSTLTSMIDSIKFALGTTREAKARPMIEPTTTTTTPFSPPATTIVTVTRALSSGSVQEDDNNDGKSDLTSNRSGRRSKPWDTALGRCLSLQSVYENERSVFKYAAGPCGYEKYFICKKM